MSKSHFNNKYTNLITFRLLVQQPIEKRHIHIISVMCNQEQFHFAFHILASEHHQTRVLHISHQLLFQDAENHTITDNPLIQTYIHVPNAQFETNRCNLQNILHCYIKYNLSKLKIPTCNQTWANDLRTVRRLFIFTCNKLFINSIAKIKQPCLIARHKYRNLSL